MGDPAMTEHLGGPERPEKIAERQARYEVPGRGHVQDRRRRDRRGRRLGRLLGAVSGASETVHEVGWSVVPAFQGRGLASAATALGAGARPARRRRTGYVHAFPSIDNPPSNGICRKLGFTLLEVCRFEYPPASGNWMYCNDWRLDLVSTIAARWRSRSRPATASPRLDRRRVQRQPRPRRLGGDRRRAGRRRPRRAVRRRAAHDQQPHGVHGRARGPALAAARQPRLHRHRLAADARLDDQVDRRLEAPRLEDGGRRPGQEPGPRARARGRDRAPRRGALALGQAATRRRPSTPTRRSTTAPTSSPSPPRAPPPEAGGS